MKNFIIALVLFLSAPLSYGNECFSGNCARIVVTSPRVSISSRVVVRETFRPQFRFFGRFYPNYYSTRVTVRSR